MLANPKPEFIKSIVAPPYLRKWHFNVFELKFMVECGTSNKTINRWGSAYILYIIYSLAINFRVEKLRENFKIYISVKSFDAIPRSPSFEEKI